MKSSTVASPFVVNMLEGARQKGYNINAILQNCGINPEILRESKSRITFGQLSRLSLYLVKLMDDESIGLMDKPQRQNTFKMMSYAMINAETIYKALSLSVDFGNILENSFAYDLTSDEKTTTYQLTRLAGNKVKNHYIIEHTLFAIHRTLCWLANTRIPIIEAKLDYPQPDYVDQYRYIFFDAKLHFSQTHCSMTFNNKHLAIQNVKKMKDLKTFLRQLPLTFLSQTTVDRDLPAQIRSWMERQLINKKYAPDIELAADHFGLHPQTMRRILKREGTTFKDIKMELRRDLAVNMINNKSLSIERISEELAFSEPSAFIRSFKKWTGLTPLAYRKLSD